MIKINYITIHNFGIIKDEKIVFNERTVINGDNGEGKSTVLKVLAYIFTGEIPGETPSPIKIADQTNWDINWNNKEVSFLHCNFNINSDNYTAEIVIKKNGASKRIFKGEEVIAETNTDYDIKMNKWFDQTIAKYIIFSPQSTTQLVTAKPAELRDLITSMYQIDFTKQIEDVKIDDTKKLLVRNNKLKDDLELKIYKLTVDLNAISNQRYDQPKKVKEIKQDYIDSLIVQKNAMDVSIVENDKQLDIINDKINIIKELKIKIENNKDNIDDYNQDIKNNKLKIKEYEDANILTNAKIDEYNESTKFENNEKILVKKELDETLGFLIELGKQGTKQDIEYKILEANKEIELAEEGKCKECGAIHTYNNEQITQMKNNLIILKQIETDYILLESKKERMINDIKYCDDEIQKNNTFIINKKLIVTHNNDNIKKENDDIASLNAKIKKENSNITMSKKRLVGLNKFKVLYNDIMSYKEVLSNAKIANDYETKIADTKNDLKNYNQYLLDIKQYNDDIKKKTEDILAKTKEIGKTENHLADKKEDIIVLHKTLEEEKIIIQRLKSDLPAHISNDILQALVDKANKAMSKMYHKYFIDINKTKHGISLTYNNGKAVQVASGAEKAIINLAFQIAIGDMLRFGPIIMDEIDAAMSSENSEKVFDNINKLLEDDVINQVIAITHLDTTKKYLVDKHYDSINMIDGKVY